MRILIHGLNFAPEPVGVGKTTGETAEWLAARGHDVRVVTAPPFNPQWKVAQGFSAWRYSRSDYLRAGRGEAAAGRLTVLRCPVWVPLEPSAMRRILHLASFALASFPVMLKQVGWRPEVVMVMEPTLFCVPTALLTGRFCGARTWLHILDFEADAAFELGLLNSSRLRRVVEWVEKKFMSGFGRVSTISEKMLQRLEQKGVGSSACRLFPNWVDTETIFPLAGPSPLRKELGIPPGDVVALYAGTMARKQGLELLAEAASRLAGRADVRFVLCGEGPGKAALGKLTSSLANVQWIPMQPLARLNELLNLADIHLLPQKADAADLVMPSKLTGMLASGRPVVATSGPGTQLARVVESRGIVVEPEKGADFAQAVEELADDPQRREQLGKRAREYALSELEQCSVLGRFERELLSFAATG
jgi:colanic acid biosynthesis glycosyl transferase WcaI